MAISDLNAVTNGALNARSTIAMAITTISSMNVKPFVDIIVLNKSVRVANGTY